MRRTPDPTNRRRVTAPRTITTLSAALLAALLLAGCSAGVANESAGDFPGAPAGVDGGVEEQAGGDAAADDDRSVIVTGWMTITADDPSAATRDAVAATERAGGRVDARTEYAPTNGDKGSTYLTLRIPAERLQAVIDDLGELGRVDEVSTSSADVTTTVTDLDSRIATEQGIVDRLTQLLAKASTIEDLVELETRIAEHQGTLEALTAQQRGLDAQIAYSTLELSIRSEADAPAVAPDNFLSGVVAGWGAFVTFFSGLLVVLGVLLPWIVLAGVITAVVIVIVRRRRAARMPAPPA